MTEFHQGRRGDGEETSVSSLSSPRQKTKKREIPMTFEWRDSRFDELDWLIAQGLGDVQQDGKFTQRTECPRCGTWTHKLSIDVDLSKPQYCSRCAGLAKREENLVKGGRKRTDQYELPAVRRRIYLQETGRTGARR
jgi:hypothetical protein